MGVKSLRKRSKKSSSSSDTTNFVDNSMATSLRMSYWITPLLISAALFVFVVIPLSISSSKHGELVTDGKDDLIYGIEVVNEFHHDPDAFTQGLLYGGNDSLFESTGLNGRSSVRRVALRTGKVEAINKMENIHFGEGLTVLGDRLFQVTWRKNIGFTYDRNSLRRIKSFTSPMSDGWGLATDGKILFGTDGSSTLFHIHPRTFKAVKKLIVKYKGREVHNLNELEYVNGEVWANVWMTDCIARISGDDGRVLGWIYLPQLREGLVETGNTGIDVLNGIAFDQETNRLFVTGKLWPKLYEIKVQAMKKEPFQPDIQKLCIHPKHF